MKGHPPPLRRLLLLTAALVLTAITARPAAAQCTPGGTLSGTTTLGGDKVTFGGNAYGCIYPAGDSIYLDSGWVFLQPGGGGSGDPLRTRLPIDALTAGGPVKVTTPYTVAGSCTYPKVCPARAPGFGSITETLTEESAGAFLVVFEDNTDSVTVALVSG
ncbi:MAG TPA: hypothetical protein VEQ60_26900, partial [Longimicrobium sp.]|nr:hypothetical protein [Longimicrobium sp.]